MWQIVLWYCQKELTSLHITRWEAFCSTTDRQSSSCFSPYLAFSVHVGKSNSWGMSEGVAVLLYNRLMMPSEIPYLLSPLNGALQAVGC